MYNAVIILLMKSVVTTLHVFSVFSVFSGPCFLGCLFSLVLISHRTRLLLDIKIEFLKYSNGTKCSQTC